jgi:hypothetical protein
LADQVTAVVDEQLDLPRRAVELGDGQVRVAQRGQGDRLGVDRVRLARLAATPAGPGHQPGRDPDDAVPGGEQILLEAAGQMPAVLQRELHLRPLRRPAHQRVMAVAGRRDGLLPEPAPDGVQRDHGVGALV